MSSALSVPGVEVGASWLGGCGQVLTAVALELPPALDRMLGPAAAEMAEAALQAAESPSGEAIRPAPSRSWSSSCTARGSWPRRGRAWASRWPPDGRFDPLAPSRREYVHAR